MPNSKLVICTIPLRGLFILTPKKYSEILQEGRNSYLIGEEIYALEEDILNTIWNINIDTYNGANQLAVYNDSDLWSINLASWWIQTSSKMFSHVLHWLASLSLKIGKLIVSGCPSIKKPFSWEKFTDLLDLSLVRCEIGTVQLEDIAKLTQLKILNISYNPLTDESLAYLTALVELEEIHMRDCCTTRRVTRKTAITPAGVQNIGQMTNLRVLDIGENLIGDQAAVHLAQLSGLNALYIYQCGLTSAGALAISNLSKLEKLDIGRNEIGNEGAFHVANLCNLVELEVDRCQIGSIGVQAFVLLSRLQGLDLNHNSIQDAGAFYLVNIEQLTDLTISNCGISSIGVGAICEITNLQRLDINMNQIGDYGASLLTRLSNLRNLDICDCNIGPDGASLISQMTGLQSLYIGENCIGDEGADRLAKMTQLRHLSANSCSLSEKGQQAISHLVS